MERVEYRAGWIRANGRWIPFAASGAYDNLHGAELDRQDLVKRLKKVGPPEMRAAIRAGRTEVRTRVVITTPWVGVV